MIGAYQGSGSVTGCPESHGPTPENLRWGPGPKFENTGSGTGTGSQICGMRCYLTKVCGCVPGTIEIRHSVRGLKIFQDTLPVPSRQTSFSYRRKVNENDFYLTTFETFTCRKDQRVSILYKSFIIKLNFI